MNSPKFSFQGTLNSILISLGLALLTAVATWLVGITDVFDFGQYAPVVGSLAVWLANVIRKFVSEQ